MFGCVGWGVDQEAPFQTSQLPCWSSAMQKLAEGHETAAKLFVSIRWGPENEAPFQVAALPASSTTMQKLAVGHEMESDPTLCSMDQEVPFQMRASPSTSGATQKVVEPHDTLVMPSLGFGQMSRAPADHEVPFQVNAFEEAAMQKPAEGHETWLRFSWLRTCGADHDVPFQVMALPTVLLATTAAQKLAEAHETEA